jgi:BNR repeat-like domain
MNCSVNPIFAIRLLAIILTSVTGANAQSGVSIGPPVVLSVNAGSDSGIDEQPDLATDGQGTWLAVWSSTENLGGSIGTDRDVLMSKSIDRGATWSPPKVVNSDATTDVGEDFGVRIVTDKAGNWVVAWVSNNDLNDFDIRFSRSTDRGDTWSAFGVLNTNGGSDSGNDQAPEIVTNGAGSWLAAWYSDDTLGGTIGTDVDILTARSNDGGATWTAPTPLNNNATTDTGDDLYVRLATDDSGQWLATWHSLENLGGALGVDSDILVVRSTDNGATWTAPAALNSTAQTDTGADEFPIITAGSDGEWLAVWHSVEDLGGTVGTDKDILMAVSIDAGATWSAVQLLNSNGTTDAGEDFLPQIGRVQAGDWFVTWYSSDALGGTVGVDIDILISRSTDGASTWSAPEVLNTNAATDTGNDLVPRVATDGLGNWLVAWYSTDTLGGTVGSDEDILCSKFALPDCNGNGTGDGFDISVGNSADCNSNGTPDDCDGGCPPPTGGSACGLLDSDLDGVDDCRDRCPGTPAWAPADNTGCACSQRDEDGDGVHDCLDSCPGEPDVDEDGDRVPDCVDKCPSDPDKTTPGFCGCGMPEVDTDADHVPDCTDQCPNDSNKSLPGICGCGTSDADSDFDGTPDCADACPDDPRGSDPSTCLISNPDGTTSAAPDETLESESADDNPDEMTNTDDGVAFPTESPDGSRAPCGTGVLGAFIMALLGTASLRITNRSPPGLNPSNRIAS